MSTHRGAVRSFDLSGGSSLGRRWAARCSCGAVGTSAAWPEALGFLTDHLEITARLRASWLASHPSPDLRGEYWVPVVNRYSGNGHGPSVSSLRRRIARVIDSVTRVVLGLQSFASRA